MQTLLAHGCAVRQIRQVPVFTFPTCSCCAVLQPFRGTGERLVASTREAWDLGVRFAWQHRETVLFAPNRALRQALDAAVAVCGPGAPLKAIGDAASLAPFFPLLVQHMTPVRQLCLPGSKHC